MLRKIERMLPHAAILICNMYVVFFLIDRVNPAMNFIDNGLTKGLLLVMCAVALYDARRLLKAAQGRRNREPASRAYPEQRAGYSGRAPQYRTSGGAYDRRYAPRYDSRDTARSAPPRRYDDAGYDRRKAQDSRYDDAPRSRTYGTYERKDTRR